MSDQTDKAREVALEGTKTHFYQRTNWYQFTIFCIAGAPGAAWLAMAFSGAPQKERMDIVTYVFFIFVAFTWLAHHLAGRSYQKEFDRLYREQIERTTS